MSKPKHERKPQEESKPAPNSLAAKLLELLRTCEVLPYPENMDFWRVPDDVRSFLPPNSEVLRTKLMRVMHKYLSNYDSSSDKDVREKKCTVFYVLMLIAQGVSEGRISLDSSKKLTWKYAGELLDKVNAEYFDEHPEVSKPSDYEEREGKDFIAGVFGSYPPEVILEDKAFIQALLPSTKHNN